MDTRGIRIEEYDYPLPPERIAKYPLARRDGSKLLVWQGGEAREEVFTRLPDLLPAGELMLFNNTRVIQARLRFGKETGATVETLLLEPAEPREYAANFARRGECTWLCLAGHLKRWKTGALSRKISVGGKETTLSATKEERQGNQGGGQVRVTFRWTADCSWAEVLEAAGELPIPPYLNRKTEESDKTSYQTVYARREGSVAAPTAGLHFTSRVLEALDAKGIDREELTLHVGAGTFRPVRSETIGEHEMHAEHIAVRRQTVEKLISHKGRATAVGTTSVRTAESLYHMALKAERLMTLGTDTGECGELDVSQWEPYEGADPRAMPEAETALKALLAYMDRHGLDTLHASTQIIIAPGYEFRIVRAMLTNFHQPKSTLLLLVSAFVGEREWRKIYDFALGHDFRFLSYGDASLLIP